MLLVAVAVPNTSGHGVSSNEASAVASLVVTLAGQATFHRKDFYRKGELVYANSTDGRGAYDLYELPDGMKLELIDLSLAKSFSGEKAKAGYWLGEAEGDRRQTFGYFATPARYMYDNPGHSQRVMICHSIYRTT